jgi:hypothetical protein
MPEILSYRAYELTAGETAGGWRIEVRAPGEGLPDLPEDRARVERATLGEALREMQARIDRAIDGASEDGLDRPRTAVAMPPRRAGRSG